MNVEVEVDVALAEAVDLDVDVVAEDVAAAEDEVAALVVRIIMFPVFKRRQQSMNLPPHALAVAHLLAVALHQDLAAAHHRLLLVLTSMGTANTVTVKRDMGTANTVTVSMDTVKTEVNAVVVCIVGKEVVTDAAEDTVNMDTDEVTVTAVASIVANGVVMDDVVETEDVKSIVMSPVEEGTNTYVP